MIPPSVSAEYRQTLIDYHPQSGLALRTINESDDHLSISTQGDWPLPSRDLMQALKFVTIPGTESAHITKKPDQRPGVGPWILNNATMEKVPATDTQQIILQWYFPGHEYVYTAWKWG